MTTSISDHLPQFIMTENFKELYEINKDKFSYRNFKNFNEKYFIEELRCIDWSLATKNGDLDFFPLFNKNLDKHAPMKQGEERLRNLN